jgi:hypothetical protein
LLKGLLPQVRDFSYFYNHTCVVVLYMCCKYAYCAIHIFLLCRLKKKPRDLKHAFLLGHVNLVVNNDTVESEPCVVFLLANSKRNQSIISIAKR